MARWSQIGSTSHAAGAWDLESLLVPTRTLFGGALRLPLRARVMLTVALVQLCVTVVAVWLLALNAREAVREEIDASVELARNLSLALVAASLSDSDPAASLADLPIRLQQPRHVRITLLSADGNVISSLDAPRPEDEGTSEAAAPDWFRRLVGPTIEIVTIPIRAQTMSNGGLRNISYGAIMITTEPSDELAEVWQDTRDLVVLMLAAFVVFLLLIHLLLVRALRPIATILDGLEALQGAFYDYRLPRIPEPDLDRIGQRFNALAAQLEATNRENDRIGQKLVTLQDSERETIAHELHDEFGPCLFGIQANAHHIKTACESAGKRDPAYLAERADVITEIAEQMQEQSRGILRRLRPMALGQVGLPHLLADLTDGFRAQFPEIEWRLAVPEDTGSFGDTVDLTIYRMAQECMTNAVRHAEATRVDVVVTLDEESEDAPDGSVTVTVQDDGRGLPTGLKRGLGLTGMGHRVGSLGGRFWIANRLTGGAEVRIRIPVKRETAG